MEGFAIGAVTLVGQAQGRGDSPAAHSLWLPSVWLVASVWNTMPALWSTMVLYVVVISIGSAIRWFRGSWRKIRLV